MIAWVAKKESYLDGSGYLYSEGGVSSQIIGIGSITWALGKVKTSLASLTLMSEPLTAAILGIFLLGELLSIMQILGGIVILVGILIAQNNSELKGKVNL